MPRTRLASEAQLHEELFGARPVIEAVLGREDGRSVGFALYFHNFSTFLSRRGLYLEDLFVVPEARGRGYGRSAPKCCRTGASAA